MHADAFFAIGKAHMVCQDYARAGIVTGPMFGERACAVISDGCSTSPDTDVGARLLTLAGIRAVNHAGGDRLQHEGPLIAACAQDLLCGHLQSRALDATLLVVHEADGIGLDGDIPSVQVVAWGDGVIFAVRTSGEVWTWELDHGGMPAYLSYLLDAQRGAEYDKRNPGRRIIGCRQQGGTIDDYTMPPHERVCTRRFSMGWSLVGVASDGLMSFRDKATHAPIPLAEVIKHVVDIRVKRGAFIQRSSKFFLEKTCAKLGWEHTDDYAVAAINLTPTEGGG